MSAVEDNVGAAAAVAEGDMAVFEGEGGEGGIASLDGVVEVGIDWDKSGSTESSSSSLESLLGGSPGRKTPLPVA